MELINRDKLDDYKFRSASERMDLPVDYMVGWNDAVDGIMANAPTVEAIPVEWINKYTNEHRTYMHAFSEMVACWYDEKEKREYEMASDMRDYCEKYEPTYNPEDGSM